MTAGPVNRVLLESNYQNAGDVYSDLKTEGAFNVLANQIDDNFHASPLSIYANVKEYGATGDGVTDDTSAIQLAINSLANTQAFGGDPGKAGGILLFPKGNYRISSSLNINLGIVVRGNGTETSVITPLPSFVGTAAIIFRQNNTGYSTVDIGVETIEIDMDNVSAHAILAYKAYDCVTFTDINVVNVADAYNAYRFIPDPLITDTISQTLLLTNCMGIHKFKTATAPVFYLEDCQEINMIGCKAFATRENQLTPPGYADAPLLNPYHFADCRGVTMIGCSAAFAGSHAIKIEGKDRLSNGFLITGCTFETCPGGLLRTVGTVTNLVRNISLRQNRIEGTVGGISLDFTDFSLLETGNKAVTISANCQQIHIYTEDYTQITDNGLYTNIFGYGNAVNSSFVVYPSVDVTAKQNPNIEFKTSVDATLYSLQYDKTSGTDTGLHIRKNAQDLAVFDGSDLFFHASGVLNLKVSHPFAANQTGILLTVNNGAAVQRRVEIGAADSGGLGYRMLRVQN